MTFLVLSVAAAAQDWTLAVSIETEMDNRIQSGLGVASRLHRDLVPGLSVGVSGASYPLTLRGDGTLPLSGWEREVVGRAAIELGFTPISPDLGSERVYAGLLLGLGMVRTRDVEAHYPLVGTGLEPMDAWARWTRSTDLGLRAGVLLRGPLGLDFSASRVQYFDEWYRGTDFGLEERKFVAVGVVWTPGQECKE